MTQDQANTLQGFNRVADDINQINQVKQSLTRFGLKTGKQSVAQISLNTYALQEALNSGERLAMPRGGIMVDGTATATNVPVHFSGTLRHGFIRQMGNVDTIVIDNSDGMYMPFLQGLRLEAGANLLDAVAIKILGIAAPSVTYVEKQQGFLSHIEIYGADMDTVQYCQFQFKKGIEIINPSQMTISEVYVRASTTKKAADTKGIHLISNGVTSNNTNIINCRLVSVTDGIRSDSTGFPGIEQLQIIDCYMPAVRNGVIGVNAYSAPYWRVTGCHIFAQQDCVNLNNVQESFIEHNLLYHEGNDIDEASFIRLDHTNRMLVNHNQCDYSAVSTVWDGPATRPLDPYGLIVSGTGVWSSDNTYTNNTFNLKAGGGKYAIHLRNGHENATIWGNIRTGGAETVKEELTNQAYGNRIKDNYPLDMRDVREQAVLVYKDDLNHALGRKFSANNYRSNYIYIPGAEAGNTIVEINDVPLGKTITLQSDVVVSIAPSASIILSGNVPFVFSPGDTITLRKTSPTELREVGRNYQASKLGDISANSGAFYGDVVMSSANNRQFTFSGFGAGQTISFNFGGTNSGLFSIFGGQNELRSYHGTTVFNDAGGNSPAVTIKGKAAGQSILKSLDSSGNAVIDVMQDGMKVRVHASPANPTAADIPNNYAQLWFNYTLDQVRIWFNHGGLMISTAPLA
ncbi:hypothetical protein [Spirosoma endophyticum]|uniref:Right handed beta helix region n=1 Tax=Spirosoma endophyticum TaxID=662367 RepID=A0A1I1UB55_9BACT|nr:hypothetical protein [Spirosoma endophyticum]SFD67865.1 hypothetical protein SAMN05216167_106194 [Spirosoma endophyticum]